MTPDSAPASATLRDCVRGFSERRAHVVGTDVIYPIAARPDQILEFYFEERYLVRARDSGRRDLAPRAVVVGPFTGRRADLILRGRFNVFTVHFQPAGFHQLFGIAMPALADQAYEARSVISRAIATIEQKLADAMGFAERVQIVSEALLPYRARNREIDAVARIANGFVDTHGAISIARAAAGSGLGVRQFERRFVEQVGVTPKLYAGIVRFDAALKAKIAAPHRRWTDIAHDFGYFDQMHMVRDFARFAGESPTRFAARLSAMSEPWA